MKIFIFILTIASIITLECLILRLCAKLTEEVPKFKKREGLILLFICLVFISSTIFGITFSKSETDVIKDYNKGLYQEKITYESIDGNIIPQDTIYIFKNK